MTPRKMNSNCQEKCTAQLRGGTWLRTSPEAGPEGGMLHQRPNTPEAAEMLSRARLWRAGGASELSPGGQMTRNLQPCGGQTQRQRSSCRRRRWSGPGWGEGEAGVGPQAPTHGGFQQVVPSNCRLWEGRGAGRQLEPTRVVQAKALSLGEGVHVGAGG